MLIEVSESVRTRCRGVVVRVGNDTEATRCACAGGGAVIAGAERPDSQSSIDFIRSSGAEETPGVATGWAPTGGGTAVADATCTSESGNMPRLTAAAFWSDRSAGSLRKKYPIFVDDPGMAASIADVAGQGKHERSGPPGRRVAASHQGREKRQRLRSLAGDCQAQGQAPPRLVPIAAGQSGAIVRLRLRMLAEQVIGETAVATDHRLSGAEPNRAGEILQGATALAAQRQRGAHSGLRKRACRPDLLGAAEETRSGLRIADRKRGTSGADEGLEIPRLAAQHLHVARKRVRRGLVIADG